MLTGATSIVGRPRVTRGRHVTAEIRIPMVSFVALKGREKNVYTIGPADAVAIGVN